MTINEKTAQRGDKYICRFPDGMRDRIAAAARTNGRSMNAQITHWLELALTSSGEHSEAAALPSVAASSSNVVECELALSSRLTATAEGLAYLLADRLRALIESLPETVSSRSEVMATKRFVDNYLRLEAFGAARSMSQVLTSHPELIEDLESSGTEVRDDIQPR